MKNLILTATTTILFTALFTATISATTLVAPMDTINKKAKTCIFEIGLENTQLSELSTTTTAIELGEEFIEEASKPSMVAVKPVPHNYTGFKVEVSKVYHEPLEHSNEIFSTFDNIMLEKVRETQFSYLTGDFKTEKQATAFITASISNNRLAVIQYKNGVRIK